MFDKIENEEGLKMPHYGKDGSRHITDYSHDVQEFSVIPCYAGGSFATVGGSSATSEFSVRPGYVPGSLVISEEDLHKWNDQSKAVVMGDYSYDWEIEVDAIVARFPTFRARYERALEGAKARKRLDKMTKLPPHINFTEYDDLPLMNIKLSRATVEKILKSGSKGSVKRRLYLSFTFKRIGA